MFRLPLTSSACHMNGRCHFMQCNIMEVTYHLVNGLSTKVVIRHGPHGAATSLLSSVRTIAWEEPVAHKGGGSLWQFLLQRHNSPAAGSCVSCTTWSMVAALAKATASMACSNSCRQSRALRSCMPFYLAKLSSQSSAGLIISALTEASRVLLHRQMNREMF